MLNISATPTGMLYRETLSIWARLFVAFIGATCGIMIPTVWLSFVDWQRFSFGTAFAILVSLVAALIGIAFVLMALVPMTTLEFDARRGLMVRSRRGPLGRSRTETPFQEIEGFIAATRESEDGPYPVVELRLRNVARPIVLVNLGDGAATAAWRKRLDELTGTQV